MACVLIDIDHFKQVNDTYGHWADDHVLQHVASLLRTHTRSSDFIFRKRGDEFLVVLPVTPIETAYRYAERWRQFLQESSHSLAGIQTPVTMSLGLATFPVTWRNGRRHLDGSGSGPLSGKERREKLHCHGQSCIMRPCRHKRETIPCALWHHYPGIYPHRPILARRTIGRYYQHKLYCMAD